MMLLMIMKPMHTMTIMTPIVTLMSPMMNTNGDGGGNGGRLLSRRAANVLQQVA